MNTDRIGELFDQAYRLPYGAEQVALIEEAVRLVDADGDENLGYQVRMELVDAANWAGMHDRAMVAFSWCLSRHQRMSEQVDLHELLWKFKWILQNVTKFAGVGREQVKRMEDDMAERLDAAGYSRRPIEYIRCLNRLRMGDLDTARADYARWQAAERDGMADCAACEKDNQVEYFAALGEDDAALKIARPMVRATRRLCEEVPHHTFGHIVRPLLRQGLLDEATELHALAMRRIDKNEKFLPAIAEQLLVLVRTHDHTRAVRMIDRHVAKACATIDDMARMRFYQAAALTLESVAGKPLKLKLPASLPCCREDHTYDPAQLAGWFQTEADRLADRFDTRNGNGYHRGLNAESRVLVGA